MAWMVFSREYNSVKNVGLRDMTCPPHINFAAYNQLKGPKEYKVYPNSGHGLPAENYNLKIDWVKKEFKL